MQCSRSRSCIKKDCKAAKTTAAEQSFSGTMMNFGKILNHSRKAIGRPSVSEYLLRDALTEAETD